MMSNTFEQSTKAVAIHAMVKGNKQGLIDGMSITALVSLENATVDALVQLVCLNERLTQVRCMQVHALCSGKGHDDPTGDSVWHR